MVIIHIHAVVSHVISIVTVIISLLKGKSIVNVIWVCCSCDICTCVQGCQFGNLVAKIGNFGTFSCCLATKNSDLATVYSLALFWHFLNTFSSRVFEIFLVSFCDIFSSNSIIFRY